MRRPRRLVEAAAGWCWFVCAYVGAFNLDVSAPIVLTQPAAGRPAEGPSYFGFSVALLRDNGDVWVMVGAPRANINDHGGTTPGGALYRCLIATGSLSRVCRADIGSDNLKKLFCDGPNNCRMMENFDNWFGVSVGVRNDNSSSMILACGHRYRFENNIINYTIGGCINATMVSPSSSGAEHSATVIVVNDDDTVIPTIDTVRGRSDNRVASAMALTGTAVHITEDGRALMGLPGFNSGKGGVAIDQNCVFASESIFEELYVGYSVTSVRMKREGEGAIDYWYVAGGPKAEDFGKVVVFHIIFFQGLDKADSSCNSKITKNIYELKSSQEFSYYGAAVCGADINGDGNDDLLVGAPYHNISRGDEGIVFVYLNNGTGFVLLDNSTLTGRMASGARFGSAIASINDINFDDFDDVVVSAPYENEGQGAIYVYHGTSLGLTNNYAQRLTPVDFGFGLGVGLRNFGRSLAGRVDVDHNLYPDLVVGAADAVVVFRSRPVHNVDVGINFKDTFIRWQRPAAACSGVLDFNRLSGRISQTSQPIHVDESRCEDGTSVVSGELREQLSNNETFCMPITVSFNYSAPSKDALRNDPDGRHKLIKTRIKGIRYILHVDELREVGLPRGFLVRRNGRCGRSAASMSATILFADDILERPAEDDWIVVFPKLPSNIVDRLHFRLDLNGTIEDRITDGNNPDRLELRNLSPVLNLGRPGIFHGNIAFERNCGADDICQPELNLILASVTPVTIGCPGSEVNITFTMRNDGELAFSNWISIGLPSWIQFVSSSTSQASCAPRQKETIEEDAQQLFEVYCESNRPMTDGSSLSFHMTFSFDNVSEDTVRSGGPWLDSTIGTRENTSDTRGPFRWVIPATYDSRLRLVSTPKEELKVKAADHQQQEGGKVGDLSSGQGADGDRAPASNVSNVVHRFKVINDGPGLMPGVVIEVRLPFENASLIDIHGTSVIANPYQCGTTISCRGRNLTGHWTDGECRDDDELSLRRRKRRSSNTDEEEASPQWWWEVLVGGLTTKENLRFLTLICEDAKKSPCRVARFSAHALQVGDSLDVTVNVSIRLSVWLQLKDVGALTYVSTMTASPGKLSGLSMSNLTLSNTCENRRKNNETVQTRTKIVSVRPPVPLPPWILVLSVGLGVIGLIVCIIILKKIGFFNRQQREKMEQEKRESARLPLSDDEVLNACLEDDGETEEGCGRPKTGGFLRVGNSDQNGLSASRDPSEYENGETDSVPSLSDFQEHINRFGARENY